jgi:hypothetical protein
MTQPGQSLCHVQGAFELTAYVRQATGQLAKLLPPSIVESHIDNRLYISQLGAQGFVRFRYVLANFS